MRGRLAIVILAIPMASSSYAFTDSLWIVGAEGSPGELVTVEVWLQYEGDGEADSISAFDIPLTYDADICTVETITIGPDFTFWDDRSRIDNQGMHGPPAVAKIGISAFTLTPHGPPPVPRGTRIAATIDFRILSTVLPPDSACVDTLMQAFTNPSIPLAFVNKSGQTAYVPLFSVDCIEVTEYACGDCNGDGNVTIADATYLVSFIYGGGPSPVGEGDVNVDGRYTIADATYIVSYIYRAGPEPCNP